MFPEYFDEMHCPSDVKRQPKTVPGVTIYRSFDFGLTPACVFSQLTPTGQWVIVDEMVATSMGIDRFSDEVLEHSARYYPQCDFIDIGDPAGGARSQTDERTCFEIMQSKGMDIQPAPQTVRLRLEGTRKALNTLIGGRPQFLLHPRCKILRRALLGGYHYRRMQVSEERYTNKPDKNSYSHVADALTYCGAWLFGDQIRGMDQDEDDSGRNIPDPASKSKITGY